MADEQTLEEKMEYIKTINDDVELSQYMKDHPEVRAEIHRRNQEQKYSG